MPRGKSNRGGNRDSSESISRGGGRQNVSSRRGLSAMDDLNQKSSPARGNRASSSRRNRSSAEESDRSE